MRIHLDTAQVREETYAGAAYLVAPTVLLVEGVHNHDLYTFGVFGLFPGSWNGRPVTLRHPIDSASASPEVYAQAIGMLFGAQASEATQSLCAETWINVAQAEALGAVGCDLVARMRTGVGVEVSIGTYARKIPRRGTWHGETYTHVVEHIAPDHLAVLPDENGACSWGDGCGLPRQPGGLVALCTSTCGCVNHARGEEVVMALGNRDVLGLVADTDIRAGLYAALAREMDTPVSPIIIDSVDQERSVFVIRFGERLLEREYTRDAGNGTYALGPVYHEVVVTRTYARVGAEIPVEQVAAQLRGVYGYREERTMETNGLAPEQGVASATTLGSVAPPAPVAPAPAPALDPEIQAAITLRQQVRQGWIATLVASGACPMPEGELRTQTDAVLQAFVAMASKATQPVAPATAAGSMAAPTTVPMAPADYSLQGFDHSQPFVLGAADQGVVPPTLQEMFSIKQ